MTVTSEELLSISHLVYGLRLAANLALPGLNLQSDSVATDVDIRLKEWATYFPAFPACTQVSNASTDSGAHHHPNLCAGAFPGGGYFGFFYGDGARFAVDRRGRKVWADWPEDYVLEDACTYLVGPVMGFVLRLRGIVCLHASAVAIGDQAVALVGSPGAGKSTTAAAFARLGFTILSDDIVALAEKGDQFLVQPGYPRVNLWPDSARQLFGSEDALPRITPTWEKCYLPLGENGHRFASSPLPLGAIYILERRYSALSAPIIEEASGTEALMALVANTYVNYLLDQNMRCTEFEVLSRVVSALPVHRVRIPDDPSSIFGLCEAIAVDARRVTTVASANATSVPG